MPSNPPHKPRKGRPPLDGTAKKAHSIHLTLEHIKLAKRLGNGNLSAGVRKALEEHQTPASRIDAILAALDNPHWNFVPYEPTIHAVRQLAEQARAIAEGKE